MSDERKYYCFCDSNCKFETMTKEQISAAIAQAMQTGVVYDENAAVVSKVKELNANGSISFWFGTQVQYNALPEKDPNCLYVITDSTRDGDVNEQLQNANYFAENAYRLAQTAAQEAQYAAGVADNAEQTAQEARNIANATCIKREFNAKPNSTEFTTPSGAAKLYALTIQYGDYYSSLTVDWMGVKTATDANALDGALYMIPVLDQVNGGIELESVQAFVNSNNTVTFRTYGGKIVHVVGYL